MSILKIALLGCLSTTALAALDGSRFLWYTQPATDWESGSLPIGNSRLGATVFGSNTEVVTINEDSIWSGPLVDRIPANGLAALPKVRQLLQAGSISQAGDMTLRDMTPAIAWEEGFSYFANLNVDFGHGGGLSNYQRWLDTRQGNSGVTYTYNGVNFTREYIASFPAGVLAARFTSSQKGALNIKATFSRTSSIVSNTASTANGVNSIVLRGNSGQAAQDNPIQFSGKAQFVADGSVSASGGTLSITGATTIDVFIDVETSYRYSSQQAWEAEIDNKLKAAVSKGYVQVKNEAISDSTNLLNRASLDLGASPNGLANLPTDQRVAKARSGLQDIQLVTLSWNYGRHLLVASSRNTGAAVDMAANLQGVWNNVTNPPWGGKYTININIEMNYWVAGQTNLIETQLPLFDLFNVARPRGEELAQKMYGCGGTVFHHNLNLWGDPAPTDNFTSSTMWPMGAAWLVQHQIDHYRFTGDLNFLRNTVYPNLVDVAKFYQCYTFNYRGYQVTGPSLSAENTFFIPANESNANSQAAMDMDIEMDNQLMRDVMRSLIEAAAALGISDSDSNVKAARDFLPKIRPPGIGSYGQILEWRQEYKEADPGNRHLSPLYGLHPSDQFSPLLNRTLSKAGKALLDHRVAAGSGSTGWSRTWMINLYARLFSGADAWKHIVAWFERYPMNNLWNSDHGITFQIDGNFGFTSGLTETLLQSHAGVVHLLPALMVDAIPTGNARGLLARGGFAVDVDWQGGKFKSAVVTAQRGGQLALRVADGQSFSVNNTPYKGPIQTTKGAKYTITA